MKFAMQSTHGWGGGGGYKDWEMGLGTSGKDFVFKYLYAWSMNLLSPKRVLSYSFPRNRAIPEGRM